MFGRMSKKDYVHRLFLRGDYEKALEEMDKLPAKDTTVLDYHRFEALLELGRYEEAIQKYDEMNPSCDFGTAEQRPEHLPGESRSRQHQRKHKFSPVEHLKLGTAYYGAGRYTEALETFSECAEREPDYYPAQCSKGATLTKMGRHAEAISHLDSVITRWPLESRPHTFKGDALYAMNEPDKAVRCYDVAIRLNPKDPYPVERWRLLMVQENQKATRMDR